VFLFRPVWFWFRSVVDWIIESVCGKAIQRIRRNEDRMQRNGISDVLVIKIPTRVRVCRESGLRVCLDAMRCDSVLFCSVLFCSVVFAVVCFSVRFDNNNAHYFCLFVSLTSDGTGNGILESPDQRQGNVGIEHLHVVLVGPLDAVELIGVLVHTRCRVEVGEWHIEFLSCLHDRSGQEEVADHRADPGAEDDVTVFVWNSECENHCFSEGVVVLLLGASSMYFVWKAVSGFCDG